MKRSCGKRVVALARRGNCAAAVRAFHKAQLYTHCTDARIGQVRSSIHACLAKGNFRDGAPAPAPAAPKPAAPAAAPVAGWWPFSKKTKKLPRDPRRMAQTVMYIPGAKGMASRGEMTTMRGAKRRRRRR